MFRINILLFWRHITEHKWFSFLSIIGLSMGIAAFMLLLLYGRHVKEYDNWNANFKRIYQLRFNRAPPVMNLKGFMAEQSPLLLPVIRNMGGIENIVRLKPQENIFLKTKRHAEYEPKIMEADSSLLKVFPFRLKYGNAATALLPQNSIILSASMAKKYFGKENAIGEEIQIGDKNIFIVNGILNDVQPGPSHIPLKAFAHLKVPKSSAEYGWGNYSYFYYVKMKRPLSEKEAGQFGTEISRKWFSIPVVLESQRMFWKLPSTMAQWEKQPNHLQHMLLPVHKVHLLEIRFTLIVLGVVSLIILLACCLNFSNQQIIAATLRNKEIGIRKISGCSYWGLLVQLLSETTFVCILAFLLAATWVEIALPFFNYISEEQIPLYRYLSDYNFDVQLLATLLGVALISGFYPALFMSSFPISDILKGTFYFADGGFRLRTFLLGIQFAFSLSVGCIFFIITLQASHLENLDLGFRPKGLVYANIIPDSVSKASQRERLRQKFAPLKGIRYLSFTDGIPLQGGENNFDVLKYGQKKLSCRQVKADQEYFNAAGIKLISGRPPKDGTNEIVVNEKLVENMHLPEPAIGKQLAEDLSKSLNINIPDTFVIVGTVANTISHDWNVPVIATFYHATSMNNFTTIIFRIQEENEKEMMTQINRQLGLYFPHMPPQLKKSETDKRNKLLPILKLTEMVLFFAAIIAFISLSGLITYTTFYLQRRRKELMIRKVAGAGNGRLFWEIVRLFLYIILITLPLAWTITYFSMKSFLDYFAFAIPMPYWTYIVIGLLFVGIIMAIVKIQLHRTLQTEPAEILKYE